MIWVRKQLSNGVTTPFNPWRGCEKISEGCAHCYAETQSHRNPAVLGEWGKGSRRSIAAPAYWQLPEKWNSLYAATPAPGPVERRGRVFCASLADWLEDRTDLDAHRFRLLDLIRTTPYLDWLLLSKRPQNWSALLTRSITAGHYLSPANSTVPGNTAWEDTRDMVANWLDGKPPSNVWIGATIENETRAVERCAVLCDIPARVHFASAEPLLDLPVTLTRWFAPNRINWVIVGGESGSKARPFNPDWARVLLDMTQDAGVAFFMKQMGDNPTSDPRIPGQPQTFTLRADLVWDDIPPDLRYRQFPTPNPVES